MSAQCNQDLLQVRRAALQLSRLSAVQVKMPPRLDLADAKKLQ